ncbi:MAG: hypothetical protein P4L65_02820 [Legionella sp.]|nr:hypothetical protein [Legionella sp.]
MGQQRQDVLLKAKEEHNHGEPWSVDQLETIPHLHHIARSVRAAISATNKNLRETEHQNNMRYQNFISLLNNDIVFRLLVTNQYYLLAKLFEDPYDEIRLAKLIDRIQHHERRKHQVKGEWEAAAALKTNISIPQYRKEDNEYLFQWTHPDPNLSNIEKWQHYEQEIQRITFHFHVQKARIYHESCNSHIDRVGNLLNVLRQNEPEYREEIKKLEVLHKELTAKSQAIKSKPLYKPDGSYDLEAAETQATELKVLNDKVSENLDDILGNYNATHPVIGRFKLQHDRDKLKLKNQIREVTSEFVAQTESIKLHQQEVYVASKQEALDSLDKIIQYVKSYETDEQLEDEQNASINKLKMCRQSLAETDDLDSMRQILQVSKEELIKLKDIIPAAAYSEIQSELAVLEKMVIRPGNQLQNISLDRLNPSQAEYQENNNPPSYEEAISPPIYQVHELPPPYEVVEPPVYQEIAGQRMNIEPSAPPMPDNEVQPDQRMDIEPSAPPMLDNEFQPEQRTDIEPSAPSMLDNEVQHEQPERLAASVRSVSQVGMFAPASQDLKQRLIAMKLISSKVDKIINAEPLVVDNQNSAQLQEVAQIFKAQIIQIKKYSNYQEVPNEMKQSFSENLKKLADLDKLFNSFNVKYASLFKPEEVAEHQNRI